MGRKIWETKENSKRERVSRVLQLLVGKSEELLEPLSNSDFSIGSEARSLKRLLDSVLDISENYPNLISSWQELLWTTLDFSEFSNWIPNFLSANLIASCSRNFPTRLSSFRDQKRISLGYCQGTIHKTFRFLEWAKE